MSKSKASKHLHFSRHLIISYFDTNARIKTCIINRILSQQIINDELLSVMGWSSVKSMCPLTKFMPSKPLLISHVNFRYYQKAITEIITSYFIALSLIKNRITKKNDSLQYEFLNSGFLTAENWRSIESMCTVAINLDTSKVELFITRGIARFHQQKFFEAIDDYAKAKALDPLNRQAIVGLARSFLLNGQVDEAEDIVRDILDSDIKNREAHGLLKQIAFRKFRRILTKNFPSGEKNRFANADAKSVGTKELDQLSDEEVYYLQLDLMKYWCDLLEHREDELLYTVKLNYLNRFHKLIFSLCSEYCAKLEEHKCELLCLYLKYSFIIEDPQSAIIEQKMTIVEIANCQIKIGNFESARNILPIALSIEDPEAVPEAMLLVQFNICDLQYKTWGLVEPYETLENVRKEAVKRGIQSIILMVNQLMTSIQANNYNDKLTFGSIDRTLQDIAKMESASDEERAGVANYETTARLLRQQCPTETECSADRNQQVTREVASHPIAIPLGASKLQRESLLVMIFVMKAMDSKATINGNSIMYNNKHACEEAVYHWELLIEEAHKLHNYTIEINELAQCAVINQLLGKIERADQQFLRSIKLAKELKHQKTGEIYFNYSNALSFRGNLKEALLISVEAQTHFLNLSQNGTSEDISIILNENICALGRKQMLIFTRQGEFVNALYAMERNSMPALRKNIYIPLIESDSKNQVSSTDFLKEPINRSNGTKIYSQIQNNSKTFGDDSETINSNMQNKSKKMEHSEYWIAKNIPVLDSPELEIRSTELLFQLNKYSQENTAVIIYLCYNDSGIVDSMVRCWIIFPDRYQYLCFSLTESDERDEVINTEFTNSNLFRTFPVKYNSNTSIEKQNRFFASFCKQLWEKIEMRIRYFPKYNFLKFITQAKRLIIIPDYRLHSIPFVLLGNNYDSNSLTYYPLLMNFTISISPSFWALSPTWMKSDRATISRKSFFNALLIGNPENNLPVAKEEVSLVDQILKPHCKEIYSLIESFATKDEVLGLLSHSSVVHIASHGNLNADGPDIRAGVIKLADGTLSAKEIEV